MKLIDFIRRLFRKLQDIFQENIPEKYLDSDFFEVIDPEQTFDGTQVILPHEYEFSEEEKLSVLRRYDYIYLPQFILEQPIEERG